MSGRIAFRLFAVFLVLGAGASALAYARQIATTVDPIPASSGQEAATAMTTTTVAVLPEASSASSSSPVVATSTATQKTRTMPNAAIPASSSSFGMGQCSDGWYITGYFTPHESDYSGPEESVMVQGAPYAFNAAFLKEIKTEGWGKTRLGNYIGHYDDSWHFSDAAMDANGKALKEDAIAIDPDVIGFNKKVTIPTLPLGWGEKIFVTSDIGWGVRGKHIDVYTGEGTAAQEVTFTITGQNQRVCIE